MLRYFVPCQAREEQHQGCPRRVLQGGVGLQQVGHLLRAVVVAEQLGDKCALLRRSERRDFDHVVRAER